MKRVCIIKLGDFVEGLLQVIFLGRSKDIATWIAHKLGYEDCGCDQRKDKLNNLVGCYQKTIKL
jgi:hypothetical protein